MFSKVVHRLKLATHVFLRGGLPENKRNPIPPITQQEVKEAKQIFPLDKFFIFGHARSGTTLLTRLVRLHPDVHCNYQGHFFTRKPTLEALVDAPEIESWFVRRSNRWNQGRDLSPVVLRCVVDYIMEREARPLGAKIVGDKSPNSLLDGKAVELLHKVYPDGKLVFILRDGRDAAISHRFQTFIDATQYLTRKDWEIRADFETNPEPYFQGKRSVFTEQAIRNAAEGWARNVRETDTQGKALFNNNYIALRYEDLLADPLGEMTRLWAFLGLDVGKPELPGLLKAELAHNPDRDWQQEKAGDLVEPLEKGKSGSWRDLFTERDKKIFKDFAGETLMLWDYESTQEW